MHGSFKAIFPALLLGLAAYLPAPALSDGPMAFIYNAPESALDRRYDYHWEILKTALERTSAKYGDYIMRASARMSEKRQTLELIKGTDEISVMHLGTTQALEQKLLPVRIPVDKNLSGYMVYLIRKDLQDKFDEVRSLSDLQSFTIGQGTGWLDVEILQHNGFKVVQGANYDGLFTMLIRNRFDAFQRSAVEVLDEYDQRSADMPDLQIEKNVLLYYPLPMYFWFSKTSQGQRLAARAREGMMMMIEDGTYDEIFNRYHADKIKRLGLRGRRFFKIDNPLLSDKTPFADKRLWFDPRLP
jgi:ABC-type amino acid transport substrate-binding protein